jgi:hypothetical protein
VRRAIFVFRVRGSFLCKISWLIGSLLFSLQGGREVDDFIRYLARESTSPLQGYGRDGKKVKPKKTEL